MSEGKGDFRAEAANGQCHQAAVWGCVWPRQGMGCLLGRDRRHLKIGGNFQGYSKTGTTEAGTGPTWLSGGSENNEIREGSGTKYCSRVPTVADDENEGGRSQTGAVLCSQCEQEDHSLQPAESGERLQAKKGARIMGDWEAFPLSF